MGKGNDIRLAGNPGYLSRSRYGCSVLRHRITADAEESSTTQAEKVSMKTTEGSKRAAQPARSGAVSRNGKVFLEIPLDRAALRAVKALARASGRTPFGVCVSLLRPRLSADGQA